MLASLQQQAVQYVTMAMPLLKKSAVSCKAQTCHSQHGVTCISWVLHREKVEALFSSSEKTLDLEPCTG